MFINEAFAIANCTLAQCICMWSYAIYQEWDDHKIDGSREISYSQAAIAYTMWKRYEEESEKWYNTALSIHKRRLRTKKVRKFYKMKYREICDDFATIVSILVEHRQIIKRL